MKSAESMMPNGRDFSSALLPRARGSRVPYALFSSKEVFEREQERIFRGPTWNFLGLDAEIPLPGDYKSSFIGTTPVVMTRTADGELAAWINRCAHRGATLCRHAKGNTLSHSCVYHQWTYDSGGDLVGVPFRRGHRGMAGMPASFDMRAHGLHKLRVENYKGLVFATFDADLEPVAEYIGPQMRAFVDRIMHKPIVYLGCTRQYSRSNWKLYFENVKDPYHASLLHLFHTTFNIFRVGMRATCRTDDRSGLHSIVFVSPAADAENTQAYKDQGIRSYDEGFQLEDDSILALIPEYDEVATNHIQTIFPQLVLQQIHNSLVARQLIATGPDSFELVFHFFGYADDSEELRALRIKQANLVGPAGYISMEDTEATELVQEATIADPWATSVIDMSGDDPQQENSVITESLIRAFWNGYAKLMGSDQLQSQAVGER